MEREKDRVVRKEKQGVGFSTLTAQGYRASEMLGFQLQVIHMVNVPSQWLILLKSSAVYYWEKLMQDSKKMQPNKKQIQPL